MATLTHLFLRKTLLFILFGLLWVIFTDYVLLWLIPSLPQFAAWQTAKGWLYVIVTTGIFFLLLTDTYRREQQALARQSEIADKYELLFQHNPLPMWVYDIDTLGFLAANQAANIAYGYSSDEFLNLTLRDIRPVEDNDRLIQDVEKPWPPLNFAGEWRHKRKDGRVFPVEITSYALPYEGRNARLVVAQDITQRKQAEQSLQESEMRFRQFAENAQDLIYRYEFFPEPRFSYVSPSAEIMTGYTPQDHYDNPQLGYKLIHPEDRHLLEKVTVGQSVQSKPLRLRWVRKDGQVMWTEQRNTSFFNDSGELVALEGIARDITEQAEMGLALQESEKRFRKAIEEAPLPAIIHAEDGEILALSRVWLEITGYEIADIPTIADWTERAYGSRQNVVQAGIDRLYALDRRLDEGEFEIICADGKIRVWMFSSTPLGRIADGRRIVVSMAMDVTERKETESRMQLLIASLEAAANAIVLTDVNGNLEWVNSAFSELTGYTREEALGKNPRELVKSGKHGQEFYEELWGTILRGQVWRGELINRRKDGTLYTEEESITPVRNQTGEIDHFIAVKQDISERKQVETAIQESELRYRSLFENNQVVMLLIDPQDGAIVDANHAAAHFYGWSREELKRQKISEINTLSPAEVQLEMERAKNEERSQFFFRHRLANGRIRDVEVTSGPVHLEGRALLYSTIFDVTEQKEVEREREQLLAQVQVQAEQVMQIMYSVPEGVCLLDPNGKVLMTNPKAEAKLSFLANIGVGDKLVQLGERPLASLLTSPPLGEWHGVEKNGRIFQVIVQPLENGPIPQGWVLVIWEVTEQRMIQRQLQSQERLAVVGQLAAGIAHDFNNILAIIALYAQNLQQSAKLSENEKNRLNIIDQQAQRASQLVQQVLDFSRRSVMIAKPLDMLPVLKEEVKLLQRILPEHITIRLKYAERSCFVQADPTRLQQVVMNLALNARDAMPDGGSLLIEVDRINVPNRKQAPLPQMKPGNWIRWRVSDTGSGIDPALLDHVFEPFFTTKGAGQGTGLGLAQVHGIVGQHGGHITVESQLNIGTTFTIYLPAFEAQPAPPTTEVEEMMIPYGNRELILIVEDSQPLREALKEVLTSWNYNVAAAANGLEALELMKTSTQEIRLVISDMVMPKMGGVGLLRAMQDAGWSIPVIFLTGHPINLEERDLEREGKVKIMLKPFDIKEFAETLRQAP